MNQSHPNRGRRYSPAIKAEILERAKEVGVSKAARQYGCAAWTIYDWRKKAERESSAPAPEGKTGNANSVRDERHELILELWRQQPGFGPSQIRNLLKRKGFKASVNTVRAIMEEHGYVQPKLRRKEHTGRFEAVRPSQLWHLDFLHFYVHRQKQCLLLILDDCSRFIIAFRLLQSEHADGVVETFTAAVNRYGRPTAAMSDRGSAFHSWKGLSRFEALLEEHGIDHYLAKEPAVNGKIEKLNAAIQKELVSQFEFVDLADAHRHVDRWVHGYNYERPHHALGGILVPADRFHGWHEETLRRIERGQSADRNDLWSPVDRPLELFKIVSTEGKPQVYLMGQRLMV